MKKLLLILILAMSGTFLGLVAKAGSLHTLDLSISYLLQSFQYNLLVQFERLISLFEFLVIFIVPPLFFYLRQKGKKAEAYLVLLAGLSWFAMRLLKAIFNVPCPTANDVSVLYSFHNLSDLLHNYLANNRYLDTKLCYPSGHVFDYITLWGGIYYLRKQITDNKTIQKVLAIFSVFLIVLVGQSRIYLGAHWFTDVAGGYLFGFAWLSSPVLIYKQVLLKNKLF